MKQSVSRSISPQPETLDHFTADLNLPFWNHTTPPFEKSLPFQQMNQVATNRRFPIQTVRFVQQHFIQTKRPATQTNAKQSVDMLACPGAFVTRKNDDGMW